MKVRFVVDENVDHPVVSFLRDFGYDVTSIAESSPSMSDKSILNQAAKEGKVIITCDKDFGLLAFKERGLSSGVILLRLDDQSSRAKIEVLRALLEKYESHIRGNFVVVSSRKVRVRKIPKATRFG